MFFPLPQVNSFSPNQIQLGPKEKTALKIDSWKGLIEIISCLMASSISAASLPESLMLDGASDFLHTYMQKHMLA